MSMSYSKADTGAIDRVVTKVKTLKPRVKPMGFGRFEVQGTDQPYIVVFNKSEQGAFEMTYGCRGNSKGTKPCFHAVLGAFKLQVKNRAAEQATLTTGKDMPDCNGCGKLSCLLCNPRYPASLVLSERVSGKW
jgi:hypothetical protein